MIAIAKTTKTVGLKGEIKVYPYSQDTSIREGLDIYINKIEYKIKSVRFQKKLPVIKLYGINDVECASKIINNEIFIKKEDISLEENEFLVIDLIGLDVYTNNQKIGIIENVLTEYNNDIYVVKTDENIKYIPAVKEFVKDVDLVNGKVIVELIEGL